MDKELLEIIADLTKIELKLEEISKKEYDAVSGVHDGIDKIIGRFDSGLNETDRMLEELDIMGIAMERIDKLIEIGEGIESLKKVIVL